MQIPENPDNRDIREALLELREELGPLGGEVSKLRGEVGQLNDKVDKLDFKFDTYQKGTDGMVRMATTSIIATATVVII
ncbi:hypothetical protein [Leptodesmis sichuanensis]|uniref:hypothetical protein n=1 Tax=Leptodesmis sichuanensis TaxID=2906798 RepID=UPI001F45E44F|nr:hypothetical protein [Leptodesmis sichuanensis]UIE37887.1 hypothetical protein KIK02_23725 [Leptodesmis sichuanensis A121]